MNHNFNILIDRMIFCVYSRFTLFTKEICITKFCLSHTMHSLHMSHARLKSILDTIKLYNTHINTVVLLANQHKSEMS